MMPVAALLGESERTQPAAEPHGLPYCPQSMTGARLPVSKLPGSFLSAGGFHLRDQAEHFVSC